MLVNQAPYHTQKNIKNLNDQPPWKVALIANLKSEFIIDDSDPPDAGSEFDSIFTIQSITNALESDGHSVHLLHADHTLPAAIENLQPRLFTRWQ